MIDYFVVWYDNQLVTGIADEIVANIFVDGVESTVDVEITELGNGQYSAEFEPDQDGDWFLNITHSGYFPFGKSARYEITEEKMDRLLGLSHENYLMDNIGYNVDGRATTARMRLYPNSGLTGTPTAEYLMTSTYDTNGNMLTHRVKKVG